MRRSKKPRHRLDSVRNCFFPEIEQRPGSAEIAAEPEEKSELGPGLQAAESAGLISLPHEIIEDQLASYLTCGEFNAFMNTNHFFADDERLKQARLNAERPFKMAGDYYTLQFSAFGPLIQWGKENERYEENSKSDPIEHRMELAPGEWIREAVTARYFNLLLTNLRVLMNGYCPFIPLREPDSRAEGFNECLIDLEPDEQIIKIAASGTHCVLLSSAKQVLVCGSDRCKHLGLARQEQQTGFKKLALALLDDEWVVDVAAGEFHTLLRTNRNRVLVSGFNENGQLGLSHKKRVSLYKLCSLAHVLHAEEDIKSMAVGGAHSVLLTTSNRMLVSGSNKCGQLGLDQSVRCSTSFTECIIADLKPGESIERVAIGHTHNIVLTNHHRLFVCGDNEAGQLGLQSLVQYTFTECPIDGLGDKEVIIDVTVGGDHTLLTTNQKRVLVSGNNFYGQLGLGYQNEKVFTFQKSRISTHYKPPIPLEPESKEEELGRASRKRKNPAS